MDIVGERIGPYTIVRLIGHGGMGNVYLATGADGQKVALKLLHMHMTAIPEYVKRFQMEAKLARKLTHPNVVRVLDCGEVGGQHFIAMEYVEGESLAQRMERAGIEAPGIKWSGGAVDLTGMGSIMDTQVGGSKSRKAAQYQSYCGPPAAATEPPVRNLPIPEAIKIMRQVAGVLQAAADIGLIHQDLKPHNILLDRQGNAKVLDFGLAKDADTVSTIHEATGQSVGTPHYMSPEQCHGGRKVDIRSDLYSLGVTGYQMLTGRTPFLGPTAILLMSQHLNDTPQSACKVNPAVPKNLSLVLDRLLAKRRSDRHQTPAELIVDLDRVEHGGAPLKTYRVRGRAGAGLVKVGLAAAAVVLLALVAYLVVAYYPKGKTIDEEVREVMVKVKELERTNRPRDIDTAVEMLTRLRTRIDKSGVVYTKVDEEYEYLQQLKSDTVEAVAISQLQNRIRGLQERMSKLSKAEALEAKTELERTPERFRKRTEIEPLLEPLLVKLGEKVRQADFEETLRRATGLLREVQTQESAQRERVIREASGAVDDAEKLATTDTERKRVAEAREDARHARFGLLLARVQDATSTNQPVTATARKLALLLREEAVTREEKTDANIAWEAFDAKRSRQFYAAVNKAHGLLRIETLDEARGLYNDAKAIAALPNPKEEDALDELLKLITSIKPLEIAAVVDFVIDGSVRDKEKYTSTGIAGRLEGLLSGKFKLVDRLNIKKVIDERKFQLTDLVADTTKAQQLGKFLSARLLISGMVSQDQSGITVTAKVVDVENALIRQTAEESSADESKFNELIDEIGHVLPMTDDDKTKYLYKRNLETGKFALDNGQFGDAIAALKAAEKLVSDSSKIKLLKAEGVVTDPEEVTKLLKDAFNRQAAQEQEQREKLTKAFQAEIDKAAGALAARRWSDARDAATAAGKVAGNAKDPQIMVAQELATAGEALARAEAAEGRNDWQQVADAVQPVLGRVAGLQVANDSPLFAPSTDIRRRLAELETKSRAQLSPQLLVTATFGDGTRADGAAVEILVTSPGGAKSKKEGKTPFSDRLAEGDTVEVRVTAPPRDGMRFKPFTPALVKAGKRGVSEVKAVFEEDLQLGQIRSVDIGNGTKLDLVWVPEGEFDMGSNAKEASDDEKPVHHVRLTTGFWLGQTEITRRQWEVVMGVKLPDAGNASPDHPVDNLCWNDCKAFLDKLNQRSSGGGAFRLPSEAEWEYAARGGPLGKGNQFAGSNELAKVGWYSENSNSQLHPVKKKEPNELGLYDMSGNVWEWCQDEFGAYKDGGVTDPHGPTTGGKDAKRVARSGDWSMEADYCRVTFRDGPGPTVKGPGLRVVRSRP